MKNLTALVKDAEDFDKVKKIGRKLEPIRTRAIAMATCVINPRRCGGINDR
jgi:hypothetical protein